MASWSPLVASVSRSDEVVALVVSVAEPKEIEPE
jgi:hypothetical protein